MEGTASQGRKQKQKKRKQSFKKYIKRNKGEE